MESPVNITALVLQVEIRMEELALGADTTTWTEEERRVDFNNRLHKSVSELNLRNDMARQVAALVTSAAIRGK
jgi:hypothetical protein